MIKKPVVIIIETRARGNYENDSRSAADNCKHLSQCFDIIRDMFKQVRAGYSIDSLAGDGQPLRVCSEKPGLTSICASCQKAGLHIIDSGKLRLRKLLVQILEKVSGRTSKVEEYCCAVVRKLQSLDNRGSRPNIKKVSTAALLMEMLQGLGPRACGRR
jgi:hypothetical protein